MPVTEINFDSETFYDAPAAQIAVADGFGKPFTNTAYLYCDRLRITAAPDVDQATLSYEYGNILQVRQDEVPQVYSPLELQGKLVRITVPPPAGSSADPIKWFGIVDVDERDAEGGDRLVPVSISSGKQNIIAYGLAHLLDRIYVRETWINQGPRGVLKIDRGLTFNGEIEERFRLLGFGNRSDSSALANPSNPQTDYLFSDIPQRGFRWTAFEAVSYLLGTHPIRDRAGESLVPCKLIGDRQLLEWYDIIVPTDGRSVKQILDDLIPHRRGVSYKVEFNEDTTQLEIKPFTFASEDVDMPSGRALPANPVQHSLKLDRSFWIDKLNVRNTLAQRYHKVIAQGEFKTSTFTLAFDYLQFSPGWTEIEEGRYKRGARSDLDYFDLEPYQKAARNAVYRASDFVAGVFKRFVIHPDWNQRVFDHDLFLLSPETEPQWFVAPPTDSTGTLRARYDAETNRSGEPLWTRGIRIEKHLPFLEHYDYSGNNIAEKIATTTGDLRDAPEFVPPLFFIRTRLAYIQAKQNNQTVNIPIPDRWENVELMSANSDLEDTDEGRDWSIHATIRENGPQIDMTVSGGGRQHFIAPTRFAGAEEFDIEQDPVENGGIDFDGGNMRGTICILLDSRITREKEISPAGSGEAQRTLIIPVPNARLDWVAPGTVIQVKNGKLVKSVSGGFLRDDWSRLVEVANSASQWYGRVRQALKLEFRKLTPVIPLGALITTIGPDYDISEVHTVVTAIEYDFLKLNTTYETSFTDLEFT